jgi:ABC-type uncharacterized transport system permease subunit
VKTLLATIHVAFDGYHGNPLYRAVTWIPICVSFIWSPVFPTCGRFPWEAPTVVKLFFETSCIINAILLRHVVCKIMLIIIQSTHRADRREGDCKSSTYLMMAAVGRRILYMQTNDMFILRLCRLKNIKYSIG